MSQDHHPAMATGVDAKLLKSTKFPPEFNQKVDMQKVNLQVMKTYGTRTSPTARSFGDRMADVHGTPTDG